MEYLRSITCALLVSLSGLSTPAPENPWNGTWKLNDAKSSPIGASLIMTITPQADYQVIGPTSKFAFRCDGKDYPTSSQATISCVKTGEMIMDTVSKKDGKRIGSSHRVLSSDGKTFHSDSVVVDEEGKAETKSHTYVRVDATKGFAGAWRDADSKFDRPDLMLLSFTWSHLKVTFPEVHQSTDVLLGGTDSQTQGLPPGIHVTLAATVTGPLRIETVQKRDGVAIRDGSLVLSADGRVLVQDTWRPGAPQNVYRLVYEKQ